jgi:hypothetical protein
VADRARLNNIFTIGGTTEKEYKFYTPILKLLVGQAPITFYNITKCFLAVKKYEKFDPIAVSCIFSSEFFILFPFSELPSIGFYYNFGV